MRKTSSQPHFPLQRLEELKQLLQFDVEGTAEWRRRAAARYPEDHRNRRSVEALGKLAERLRDVPADHRTIQAIAHSYDGFANGNEFAHEEFDRQQRQLLSRYGFDSPEDGDPEQFLKRLGDILADVTRAEAAE